MNVPRAAFVLISLAASYPLMSALMNHPTQPDQPPLISTPADDPPTLACDRTRADAPAQAADQTPPQATVRSRFVEQQLENLDSPFTRETVIALNAIVQRSLAAINQFDTARKRRNATDTELLAVYEALSANAARAHTDMDAQALRLRKGDERFNEEIFAAMVYFVEQVDREIRAEADRLRPVQ